MLVTRRENKDGPADISHASRAQTRTPLMLITYGENKQMSIRLGSYIRNKLVLIHCTQVHTYVNTCLHACTLLFVKLQTQMHFGGASGRTSPKLSAQAEVHHAR